MLVAGSPIATPLIFDSRDHDVVVQEFGTNRPTPFTVLDRDDESIENKKDAKSEKRSGENPTQHDDDGAVDKEPPAKHDGLLSPRIFSDDATEIIGRFFFGMPPSAANPKPIVSSESFGSASSAGGRGRIGEGKAATKEDNLFLEEERIVDDADGEENDRLAGWDREEIDLWRTSRGGEASLSRMEEKAESAAEEKRDEMENWVSQRRRLLELRRKRWNWDELGPDASLLKRADGDSRAGHPSDASYDDVEPLEARRMGLSDSRELSPAMHPIPPRGLHREGQMGDNAATTAEKAGKRKGGGAVIVDDGKQHWMPDSLCKQCYSCEAPFTMLRRKHHCRLCGMIFW